MFTHDNVIQVINALKVVYPCFASEAHFQMMFTFEAKKLYGGQFDFYPEWPYKNTDLNEHIDLMIVDSKTQEKTFIEFKYKTRNKSGQKEVLFELPHGIKVTPSNMGARSIAKYDCWKDISRLEKSVKKKDSKNGFFIFLTNDFLYWKEKNHSKTYGDNFSLEEKDHDIPEKKWKNLGSIEKAIGKKRKESIKTRKYKKNSFRYVDYSGNSASNSDCRWFRILVVDIL